MNYFLSIIYEACGLLNFKYPNYSKIIRSIKWFSAVYKSNKRLVDDMKFIIKYVNYIYIPVAHNITYNWRPLYEIIPRKHRKLSKYKKTTDANWLCVFMRDLEIVQHLMPHSRPVRAFKFLFKIQDPLWPKEQGNTVIESSGRRMEVFGCLRGVAAVIF